MAAARLKPGSSKGCGFGVPEPYQKDSLYAARFCSSRRHQRKQVGGGVNRETVHRRTGVFVRAPGCNFNGNSPVGSVAFFWNQLPRPIYSQKLGVMGTIFRFSPNPFKSVFKVYESPTL